MKDLIKQSQVEAGENAVSDHLESMGLDRVPDGLKSDPCKGCPNVGVVNCLECIAKPSKPVDSAFRNPEMLNRLDYLGERFVVLCDLSKRELVGPTEWAEAVSLARYSVDRVGECGGAPVPNYCQCVKDD